MKKKSIFIITVIISLVLVAMSIAIYLKSNYWFDTSLNLDESLQIAGGLIGTIFYFGTSIIGIITLAIVWIEYLLTLLAIKIINKFSGIKKWALLSLTTIIIFLLLAVAIRNIIGMIHILCL
ncbi:MAG: hypothetical protein IJ272_01050 [Clostridia bacterium]|nr:hypothetical protein [Clostridia bacterium]